MALPSCGEKSSDPTSGGANAQKAEEASAPPPTATELSTPRAKVVSAEVMVLASSEVPDPKTAPYADCLTHIQAKVLSRNGKAVVGDETLNLVTWAFRDREWDRGGLIRRGCRLQIDAVDFFNGTPGDIQQMQRVDTINDFESPVLWLEKWLLTEGVLASFQLPPREETVAKQLALIQHTLAGYGDLVVGGVRDGWFFDMGHSGHYEADFWKGFSHRNPHIEGSYQAIQTFHEQLAERGIQLHVAIAPRSATIYPDLATNVRYDPNVHGRVNLAVADFIETLRKEGVDVIDLTPDLLANRYYKFKYVGDGEQRFPVFLQNDHHWSPIGVRIAAKTIAKHLVEEAGLKLPTEPLDFVEKKQLLAFSGVPYADWIHPPYGEIEQVFDTPYYTLVPRDQVAENSLRGVVEAPIHLLGDSFAWCHKTGNNLISRLTDELRQPLVFTGAAGGAETNVRQSWVKRHSKSEVVKHVVWLIGENALANQERWHFVRFDDSDVLTLSKAALSSSEAKHGGEIEMGESSRHGLRLQYGTEALAPKKKVTWRVTTKEPITFKEDSFFHAAVALEPVVREDVVNTAEYHFRILIGDQVAAEKHEITTGLNWERDWRNELSKFAGVTAPVTLEVEVVTGDKSAQEGFPLIMRPVIEGVEF